MNSWLTICCAALLGCALSCATSTRAVRGVPADFSLTIERTPCKGRCPAYVLHVDARGHVAYEGRHFADPMGKHEKTLRKAQLRELVAAIQAADFWAYAERYDEPSIKDVPSASTQCTMNGRTHRVLNRFNAPESLGQLQARLDSIIGQGGYQPVPEQP